MASVNKVFIVGRLGKDPDTKTTAGGTTVANFSIATSENYKDRDGNRKEETEWHRIVVYGAIAENCGKYLRKGSMALVEGKIKTRSWEDRDGNKRSTTEIVASNVSFLDAKPGNSGGKPGNGGENNRGRNDNVADYTEGFDNIQNPDDIPF
jgi:single-strand DNA-binding protein